MKNSNENLNYLPNSPEEITDPYDVMPLWRATPSGGAACSPEVAKRLSHLTDLERDMVHYGYEHNEYESIAYNVEVASMMRQQARLTKGMQSEHDVLYPEALIPPHIAEKDRLGMALPHELVFIMEKRGMKSKEIAKLTHLYGLGFEDVALMYSETMNYLQDLELLSKKLQKGTLEDLSIDQFKYIKDQPTLDLMVNTIESSNETIRVTVNEDDDSYYRVAARDWTAPSNDSGMIVLKKKRRLGKIGDAEIIYRTSFIVNLEDMTDKGYLAEECINPSTLKKVKSLEYDENWSENILSDEVGLIKEIDRIGLTPESLNFILISTTIYAMNNKTEEAIKQAREERRKSKRVWSDAFGRPI